MKVGKHQHKTASRTADTNRSSRHHQPSSASSAASASSSRRHQRPRSAAKSMVMVQEPPSGSRQPAAFQKRARRSSEPSENLSFCGCGFLGIYHVGVASCFREYAPQLSMHKIAGSSAGALVAAAHLCGNLQLAYATSDILSVAIDASSRTLGPFHPAFDINAIVRQSLERALPENVHNIVSGRLHISLTRVYDGENVIVSKFESKEDVIQALLCSCFIPIWSGFTAPKFKGVTYIDGGFSNNLLILDDKTITVSPFAGETDICPRDDVDSLLSVNLSNLSFSLTPHNLFRLSHALLPPKAEVLSELCERGFSDGIRFLQRTNLITCSKCLEIRSSLLLTTSTSSSSTLSASMATSTTTTTESSADNNENDTITTSTTSTTILSSSATTTTTSNQTTTTIIDCEAAAAAAAAAAKRYLERTYVKSFQEPLATTTTGQEQLHHEPLSQLANKQHHAATTDDTLSRSSSSGDDDDCRACILRNLNALEDSLPKQYSDRIRKACDEVNQSLYNWFYSHRPIKYLSYLAAPYTLPVDISFALFLKYLPSIGLELVRCAHELKDFLLEVARKLFEGSLTSNLMSSEAEAGKLGKGDEAADLKKSSCDPKQRMASIKKSTSESSISVKIRADCRRSSVISLTSYECCLTIVLFGRQSLLSIQ